MDRLLKYPKESLYDNKQLLKELSHDPLKVEFNGIYLPQGIPAEIRLRYDTYSGSIISHQTVIYSDPRELEYGGAKNVPPTIFTLFSQIKAMFSATISMSLDITIHCIACGEGYSAENYFDSKLPSKLYAYAVSISDVDGPPLECHSWLDPRRWVNLGIGRGKNPVHNAFTVTAQTVNIHELSNSLLNTLKSVNPYTRMVSKGELADYIDQGCIVTNKYLFIPRDPFLRQRPETWIYV